MERHADYIPFVRSGTYPIRSGNTVRPLVDGEPAFGRICEAVESAQSSAWITVAFIDRDVQMPGGRGGFFDVLDAAVKRGVDVRVLFWRSPELEEETPGEHFSGTAEEREWLAERGARFLARWDYLPEKLCHHQKSWLVDAGRPSEIAFVGGINLGQSSVVASGHPHRDGGNIHDVYVEVRGPSGTDVHHNFVQRWNEASEHQAEDGFWPPEGDGGNLEFPVEISAVAGEIPVQITRTVSKDRYRNTQPSPGADPHPIHEGERSILDQYHAALSAAKRTIYIEDQAIGSPGIVGQLHAALERGVEVAFLVPGNAHSEYVRALKNPKLQPFFDLVGRLKEHPHFVLAGIASHAGPQSYGDIYVHAKIALVDDGWATIGSTNVAERSFHGDTELNASFWHEPTVRSLRNELFQEHTGRDVSHLDDRGAFALFRDVARKNAARRASGERLEGLVFEIDPVEYGR
ncbi:MAG: phosphatidylserine/phosphatidylglycerophosphate/cardiolipin synthase family protein [bacterium]|nr:phosphatidylserine/phosphatidylglycerophosphate/cardiolipin synthase family protein [bacterium]